MSYTYPNDINSWRLIKVYGTDFRPELLDMAQTITRLGLWDWFKNEEPPDNQGYMFWSHPNVNKIASGLNDQHSVNRHTVCVNAKSQEGFQSWNKIQVALSIEN